MQIRQAGLGRRLATLSRWPLTLVDEYTPECLAIDVERRLNSEDVLERLEVLFVSRGAPEFIPAAFQDILKWRRCPCDALQFIELFYEMP
jgi:hypothetical protein